MKFLSVMILLLGYCFAQTQSTTELEIKVDSLISLNRDFVADQNFEEATSAIKAAEELSGENNPILYARCLYNHGRTFLYNNKYSEAIPFFKQALVLQNKEIGSQNADYAYSLTGFANALRELGKFEEALPLYVQSKDIRKEVLGEDHPSYFGALNNLGMLYLELADYMRAEEYFLESKAKRKIHLGTDHPDYSESLYNLAEFYIDIGSFNKAEENYLEVAETDKRNFGEDHPYYADAIHGLACLYEKMEYFDQAEPLFEKSIAISLKIFGDKDEYYLGYKENYANFLESLGSYEKATSKYEEIIEVREEAIANDPLSFVLTANNLANCYLRIGSTDKALNLAESNKFRITTLVEKSHPLYSTINKTLVDVYEKSGKIERVDKILKETSVLQRARLENAIAFMSESELSDYTKTFEQDLERMLNILHQRYENKLNGKLLTQLCFENIVFYKGFLLTSFNKLKSLNQSDSVTKDLSNQIYILKSELSTIYTSLAVEDSFQRQNELESKINLLEKRLSKEIAAKFKSEQSISWNEIQNRLNDNERVVEFIHYGDKEYSGVDNIQYSALLLSTNNTPTFIPLCEQKDILKVLNNSSTSFEADLASRGLTPSISGNLNGIYQLIWKPLEQLYAKSALTYFSPSGLLHQISFKSIKTNGTDYLCDDIHLVRLSSSRSLMDSLPENSFFGNDAVLFGGIAYNTSDLAKAKSQGDTSTIPQKEKIEFWNYLPGTKDEVQEISKVLMEEAFQVQLLVEEKATEDSFKAMNNREKSARVIHIASHAFFYPNPDDEIRSKNQLETNIRFKNSKRALVRTGIILAGANNNWIDNAYRVDKEDGILTGAEISNMNLQNTELVILSACETGLGDLVGNEGVYGLQRAFKLAGAKKLISSFWKVPDKETSILMQSFYKYWIKDNLTIRNALHRAQLDLRKDGLEPYYWAGFILVE